MTRRAPALQVEQLEDRLTPAGSVIPAGEFNWMQYSPTGELGQLVWNGGNLVYRSRVAGSWQDTTVAMSGSFTSPSYSSRDAVEDASQSAQLVFTSDGTPHVLFLEKQWNGSAGKYQTLIQHYARTSAGWQKAETIAPPWLTQWGGNNLVAAAGTNGSIHIIFSESNAAATGVGNFGTGVLTYATNTGGVWNYAKIADTADLSQDVWFTGGRWAPRFLSIAVDSTNHAHVAYTPRFYIAGAFSTVNSTLMYATNKSGGWTSQVLMAPGDGTADAGLGASIAVGPGDQIAAASYYVDRYNTGSPLMSQLMYHKLVNGSWTHSVVTTTPDGYVGGDGARFTGFSPQLFFSASGQPTIVFSDEAGQHLPVSFANEWSGQIRAATLNGSTWALSTVFRQTDPIHNQLFYPVAAARNGQITYAGLQAYTTVDGNQNPVTTDFSLVDVGAPFGSSSPPVSSVPPVSPAAPAPGPGPAPGAPGAPSGAPVKTASPTGWAVSIDSGAYASKVYVYRADGSLAMSVTPFGEAYRGGVRIARGDINGDGVADLITVTGPNIGSRIRVWDGKTARMIVDLDPFPGFRGGLWVASGDMNGDGLDDITVGADLGLSPHVKVFSGNAQTQLASFYAYAPGFVGGVRVAMGDMNRDGFDDVITAPGFGAGPHVAMFDGKSLTYGLGQRRVAGDFYFYAQQMTAGLDIAVGDVNGDGYADLIGGPALGVAHLRILDGYSLATGRGQVELTSMYAWPSTGGGLRVAAVDADGDGRTDIMTASSGPMGGRVGLFTYAAALSNNPATIHWFDPLPGLNSAVFVG